MTLDEISRRLVEDGVAQVGYSFLEDVLPLRYQHLPYGITLVYKPVSYTHLTFSELLKKHKISFLNSSSTRFN